MRKNNHRLSYVFAPFGMTMAEQDSLTQTVSELIESPGGQIMIDVKDFLITRIKYIIQKANILYKNEIYYTRIEYIQESIIQMPAATPPPFLIRVTTANKQPTGNGQNFYIVSV